MPYQPLLFDSPQISYLNTPASSFVSPPAFTVSLCDVDRPKRHLHNSISVTLTANSLSSMIIQSRTKNTQLPAPQSPSHQSSPIPPPSPVLQPPHCLAGPTATRPFHGPTPTVVRAIATRPSFRGSFVKSSSSHALPGVSFKRHCAISKQSEPTSRN
jgi:hypothetical protein